VIVGKNPTKEGQGCPISTNQVDRSGRKKRVGKLAEAKGATSWRGRFGGSKKTPPGGTGGGRRHLLWRGVCVWDWKREKEPTNDAKKEGGGGGVKAKGKLVDQKKGREEDQSRGNSDDNGPGTGFPSKERGPETSRARRPSDSKRRNKKYEQGNSTIWGRERREDTKRNGRKPPCVAGKKTKKGGGGPRENNKSAEGCEAESA